MANVAGLAPTNSSRTALVGPLSSELADATDWPLAREIVTPERRKKMVLPCACAMKRTDGSVCPPFGSKARGCFIRADLVPAEGSELILEEITAPCVVTADRKLTSSRGTASITKTATMESCLRLALLRFSPFVN